MLSKLRRSFYEWFMHLRSSLRMRVALGVALPVLIAMISLSIFHYRREYQLLEEQARLSAVRLGDMMIHSLKHAMLFKDGAHLVTTLEDVDKLENIEQIQIVGLSGKVLASSSDDGSVVFFDQSAPECQACHRFPAESRPRLVQIEAQSPILRVSTPIENIAECYDCHAATSAHLGVLLIDLSFLGEQSHLVHDLQIDLLVSILVTFLIMAGIYLMIDRLVVQRIDLLHQPLAAYATGDLSARVSSMGNRVDELSELAQTFNHMADEIERHTRERETRSHVREQAIVEERERIARELHDGMAQVLGYVNTKAMAVRLMLQKGQLRAADRQLSQLEEAARGLFVDVREAILGLKMAGEAGASLSMAITTYVEQFIRLSDIPVTLDLQPGVRELSLPVDTELQLLRIVQEGLSNVRKHANASWVWLSLKYDQDLLNLQIRDNGRGFDPDDISQDQSLDHFGLDTMQERAQAIGATLVLDSQVGKGTNILVQLNLDGQ